jgi:hypothetical protein
MKYADETGSGAMIYTHRWFSHSKVDKGTYTNLQAHRGHGDPKSLYLFFQNKESRLRTIQ